MTDQPERRSRADARIAKLDQMIDKMGERLVQADTALNKTNQLHTRMNTILRRLRPNQKRKPAPTPNCEPLFPHPDDEPPMTPEEEAEWDLECEETSRKWKAKYHAPTPGRALVPVKRKPDGGITIRPLFEDDKPKKRKRKKQKNRKSA